MIASGAKSCRVEYGYPLMLPHALPSQYLECAHDQLRFFSNPMTSPVRQPVTVRK